MIMLKRFFCMAVMGVTALALQCTHNPTRVAEGGSSSEVVGKIMRKDGTPAANTQVKLLPVTYNPFGDSGAGMAKSDTTDSAGSYSFGKINVGRYNIEALQLTERTKLLIQQVNVTEDIALTLPADTLEKTGTIKISAATALDTSNGYLYISGTSLFVKLGQATADSGYVVIDSVPAGTVAALMYAVAGDTAQPVILAQGVTVGASQIVTVRQEKPVSVCYSVGLQATALYTGTASAAGGTMTLGSPAPNNMGIGDEVQVGLNRYYISRRNSSTSFALITPRGAAADTFGLQPVSVYRAFNHLNTALLAEFGGVCAADSNHLNTTDLVNGNYQLSLACYGDGADDQEVAIQGWTTGPANFIRIYTPVDNSEVGTSQRHAGRWNESAYVLHRTTTAENQNGMLCKAAHIKMDGLQMRISTPYNNSHAINFFEQGNGEFEVSNCIFRGDTAATAPSNIGIFVYYTSGNGAKVRFYNNIIYDFSERGIGINPSNVSGYVVNNTLVNCTYGVGGDVVGIVFKNNIASRCGLGFFPWLNVNPANDYNVSNTAWEDFTGSHSQYGVEVIFTDYANGDFHLAPSDTVARNRGVANPVPGLFSNDIDGQARVAPWDVGADEM